MSGIDRTRATLRITHRMTAQVALVGLAAVTLTGCSSEPEPRAPTEQELHADDRAAPGGVKGRHVFRCDDGGRLLVDFKDQGLTIEIRDDEGAPPLALTAPAQGLQYQGETGAATFVAGKLYLRSPKGEERSCERRTR